MAKNTKWYRKRFITKKENGFRSSSALRFVAWKKGKRKQGIFFMVILDFL